MTTPFDIEKQLKNIKPESLTKEESNMLWSKIESKISEKKQIVPLLNRFPILNMFKQRLVIAALLILILVGGSFATVAAADNAKPGDILFLVDLVVEKVQIVFSNGEKKNTLKIKFAEERLDEAEDTLTTFSENEEDTDNTQTETTTVTTLTVVQSPDNIEKINNALTVALEHLEKTKKEFEEEGNEIAVLVMASIIGDLTNLAENHITNLDKFKVEIKDDGEKVKIALESSSNNLKTKFKFEKVNQGKGNNKNKGKKFTDIKIEVENNDEDDDGDDNDGENGDGNDDDGDDDEDDNNNVAGTGRKTFVCHAPPGNPNKKHTIHVGTPAVRAHLSHGDELGKCEGDETPTPSPSPTPTPTPTPTPSPTPTPTPTPDTTPPIISNLSASDIASNSADIGWDTDEDSDSKLWVSQTTPVDTSTTPSASSNNLVTNHSLSLSGLTASKTYYFIVTSSDAAGNTATSSESSFTTLEETQQDTTAPLITNITAGNISSTSATISWTTDENTTSKVFYDLSTPLVVTSSTSFVQESLLTTSHSINLTGLTASSSYYFLVSSTDGFGNTATSSEQSFVTPQ